MQKNTLVTRKSPKDILKEIESADKIVIGAGAGLSASAGLDYEDEELFAKEYNVFLNAGYKTIYQGIGKNWHLTKDNAKKYWGFWANHINYVFHSQKQLDTYSVLYELIKDLNYFIITTNGDGQFLKGKFNPNKVFSMQGSYGRLQCQHGCHQKVYDNQEMISKMLEGFDEKSLEVLEDDVPKCQVCGGLLSPNLRIDQYFVEGDNMINKDAYGEFVNVDQEKIVFLELGVGFNTPSIIRYPFEDMTYDNDHSTLIRVNDRLTDVPNEIVDKVIVLKSDIHEVLDAVNKQRNRRG